MRAGDLDRTILIQRPVTILDLYGTPGQDWTTVATMRAKMLQFATDDREGARGITTDAQITFRTRWLDGVTLEHRVIYNGVNYTIRQIKQIGRRVGLDIVCEHVST